MVKISLNYWEECTQCWLCITVKVNVYRLGKKWRVRILGPDPTRQGLDPTRPAVFVNIPDPTQPDPTRGSTWPGTTLHVGWQREAIVRIVCRRHAPLRADRTLIGAQYYFLVSLTPLLSFRFSFSLIKHISFLVAAIYCNYLIAVYVLNWNWHRACKLRAQSN